MGAHLFIPAVKNQIVHIYLDIVSETVSQVVVFPDLMTFPDMVLKCVIENNVVVVVFLR